MIGRSLGPDGRARVMAGRAPYVRSPVRGWSGGRPLAGASLGAVCISGSAILVQLARTGAATAVFYSCLPALPTLTALAVIEQRRRGTRRPAARLGAVVAGLFLAVDLVLWNHAIADVGAGIATVLGSLQVPFVALAAWMLLRERPDRGFLLALPVVMAGVVLVSGLLGGAIAGSRPVAGIVFGTGCAAAYAVFLLVLRQTSAGTPHIAGPLADATAGAAFGSALLGLAFGGFPLDIPLPSFGWLLLLSFSTRTVGWLLITSSLPGLPAAVSSLLLLLQPAAALLLAAAVLGERPRLVQLAGALLLCGGVLMVGRKAAVRPARAEAPVAAAIAELPEPSPKPAFAPGLGRYPALPGRRRRARTSRPASRRSPGRRRA